MEYIIQNVTHNDWKLLNDNNINWYLDDLEGNNIIIRNESEYNKAIKLLGREA